MRPTCSKANPNTCFNADFETRIRRWPKFAAGRRPARTAAYAAFLGIRKSVAASSIVRMSGAVSHVISGTLAFFKFVVSVATLSAGVANGFESRLESLLFGESLSRLGDDELITLPLYSIVYPETEMCCG